MVEETSQRDQVPTIPYTRNSISQKYVRKQIRSRREEYTRWLFRNCQTRGECKMEEGESREEYRGIKRRRKSNKKGKNKNKKKKQCSATNERRSCRGT